MNINQLTLAGVNDLDCSWSWCHWVCYIWTAYYCSIQTNSIWVNRQCRDQRWSSLSRNSHESECSWIYYLSCHLVWISRIYYLNVCDHLKCALPEDIPAYKLHWCCACDANRIPNTTYRHHHHRRYHQHTYMWIIECHLTWNINITDLFYSDSFFYLLWVHNYSELKELAHEPEVTSPWHGYSVLFDFFMTVIVCWS